MQYEHVELARQNLVLFDVGGTKENRLSDIITS